MREEVQDQGELVGFCFPPSVCPKCSAINILSERKGLLLAFRKSKEAGIQGGRWNPAGFIRQEGGTAPGPPARRGAGESGESQGCGERHQQRPGSSFPLSFSGEAPETVPTGEIPSAECHTSFPVLLILMTSFAFFYLFQSLLLSASFYRMKAGMQ